MIDSDTIVRRLADLEADISGQIMSKSRVVDGLLDLRLLAAHRPGLIRHIDDALRSIPGVTMAPADWWAERLDALRLHIDEPPVATTDPVTAA